MESCDETSLNGLHRINHLLYVCVQQPFVVKKKEKKKEAMKSKKTAKAKQTTS